MHMAPPNVPMKGARPSLLHSNSIGGPLSDEYAKVEDNGHVDRAEQKKDILRQQKLRSGPRQLPPDNGFHQKPNKMRGVSKLKRNGQSSTDPAKSQRKRPKPPTKKTPPLPVNKRKLPVLPPNNNKDARKRYENVINWYYDANEGGDEGL